MEGMPPRIRGIVRAFQSKFKPRPFSGIHGDVMDSRSRPHTSKIDAMLLEILKNTADGIYENDQVKIINNTNPNCLLTCLNLGC